MDEKRKINRRFLLYYMRIYDADSRQQIGNLVDITEYGVMIVSDNPIPEEKTIRLRIELTAEVSEKPYMEFSAQSKWCKPDINPHLHISGFEILDISSENAKIIHRIIDTFGFRDNRLTK
jgi:hypothetical protein